MLEKMHIRNFKRLDDVEIELGNPVVFVGPNNSGKTTALQALALWSFGIGRWFERRSGGSASKRTGVTINRRELLNIPARSINLLWRDLRVRAGNEPIRIQITVEGSSAEGKVWQAGMEFDSVDQDNLRCRPVGQRDEEKLVTIAPEAKNVKVAFLPSVSGLVSQEDLLTRGSIERRIGEGRTADVLRNLCYQVYQEDETNWQALVKHVEALFGIRLHEPSFDADTGILEMNYTERDNDIKLDLNASGQGFRQTLMLLAYMYANQRAVFLLDEPDAHLEILRQRQIYSTLTDIARAKGNQILIATHSEVIMDEAAQRAKIIAFIGKPHRTTKRDQVRKALAVYGFDDYFQAEQTRWVIYLEGAIDLAILKMLAKTLNHPAQDALERPFVHYVANEQTKVAEHFYAVREAVSDVLGVALFDLDSRGLNDSLLSGISALMWQRREIENYIFSKEALLAFAVDEIGSADLFAQPEIERRRALIADLYDYFVPAIARESRADDWWRREKISDNILVPLFERYYSELGLPNSMHKTAVAYERLAGFVPRELIDPEVSEKLDAIQEVYLEAQKRLPQDE